MRFPVRQYLDRNFRPRYYGKDEAVLDCLWCGKAQHLYINTTSGNYVCFRCDERGRGFVGVLAHVEGITRAAARVQILRRSTPTVRTTTPESLLDRIRALRSQSPVKPIKINVPLPSGFVPVYRDGRYKMPKYLTSRGVTREQARAWGLGYCDGMGRFGNRIILPIVCPNGRSFTARAIDPEVKPRYKNEAGAGHSRLLFGWNRLTYGQDLVICEGPFDAIALRAAGFGGVSLLGKTMHMHQRRLLLAWPEEAAITVMLDPEAPIEPMAIARDLVSRFRVWIARLPAKIDPGDAALNVLEAAHDRAEIFSGDRVKTLQERLEQARSLFPDGLKPRTS